MGPSAKPRSSARTGSRADAWLIGSRAPKSPDRSDLYRKSEFQRETRDSVQLPLGARGRPLGSSSRFLSGASSLHRRGKRIPGRAQFRGTPRFTRAAAAAVIAIYLRPRSRGEREESEAETLLGARIARPAIPFRRTRGGERRGASAKEEIRPSGASGRRNRSEGEESASPGGGGTHSRFAH